MEELFCWTPQHNLHPALQDFRNYSKNPARPQFKKQWKQFANSGPEAILRIWDLGGNV